MAPSIFFYFTIYNTQGTVSTKKGLRSKIFSLHFGSAQIFDVETWKLLEGHFVMNGREQENQLCNLQLRKLTLSEIVAWQDGQLWQVAMFVWFVVETFSIWHDFSGK